MSEVDFKVKKFKIYRAGERSFRSLSRIGYFGILQSLSGLTNEKKWEISEISFGKEKVKDLPSKGNCQFGWTVLPFDGV